MYTTFRSTRHLREKNSDRYDDLSHYHTSLKKHVYKETVGPESALSAKPINTRYDFLLKRNKQTSKQLKTNRGMYYLRYKLGTKVTFKYF